MIRTTTYRKVSKEDSQGVKTSSVKKKISALSKAELELVDKLQSFITTKKDAEIIISVPEMRKINFPSPERCA